MAAALFCAFAPPFDAPPPRPPSATNWRKRPPPPPPRLLVVAVDSVTDADCPTLMLPMSVESNPRSTVKLELLTTWMSGVLEPVSPLFPLLPLLPLLLPPKLLFEFPFGNELAELPVPLSLPVWPVPPVPPLVSCSP